MTTLKNGEREISVEFGTTTATTKKVTTEEKVYVIKLPTISCNNEEDAKTIDVTVNKFVSDLIKEVLKNEE